MNNEEDDIHRQNSLRVSENARKADATHALALRVAAMGRKGPSQAKATILGDSKFALLYHCLPGIYRRSVG